MRLLLVLVFLCAFSSANADTVLFNNGGILSAKTVQVDSGGTFVVDGQKYAGYQIAQWLTDYPPTVGGVHGVRLLDGRYFLGRLTSGDSKSISLRTEPLGQVIAIPRTEIVEVVFLRRDSKTSRGNLPVSSGMGLLMRPGVNPVPCRFDGVRGGQAAFSTTIGRFLLPMDDLGRYLMPSRGASRKPEVGAWEVGLTDGSIFYGKLVCEGGKLTLLKRGKAAFTLPVNALRYVRNTVSVNWLPLWKSGKALQDGLGQPTAPDWASGVGLIVGEALSLPASGAGNLRLHATMKQHDEARLIVLRDGKELGALGVTKAPSIYFLSLPRGTILTFRIESSEPSAAALLSDLVVIGKGAP